VTETSKGRKKRDERGREEERIGTRRIPHCSAASSSPAPRPRPSTASASSPSSSAQNPTRPIPPGPELLAPPGGVQSGGRRRGAGEIGSAGPRAGVALRDGRRIGCSLTPPAAA
jgi:hypothetical protein